MITWEYGKIFKTKGLDSDQTVAALKATEKMLNIIEQININIPGNIKENPEQDKQNFYGNEYRAVAG